MARAGRKKSPRSGLNSTVLFGQRRGIRHEHVLSSRSGVEDVTWVEDVTCRLALQGVIIKLPVSDSRVLSRQWSSPRKECHAGMRRSGIYGRSTPPSVNGLIQESGSTVFSSTNLPLSLVDHRLAILVDQGSDPTVPYQALVIPESAMLFSGFAPCGQKAFSARGPAAAEVYSPDSGDCTTPTPRRANTAGRMSPSSCGPRR